jgi:hypothetical protein
MTIEQRLEVLEQTAREGVRQVRRWRILATGLSIGLLAMFAIAANEPSHPVPEVVRARTFEVVGNNGTVLARLGQVQGDGGLALYGEDGKLEFVVGMTADGEAVSLLDRNRQLVRLTSISDLPKLQPAAETTLIEYPSKDPIED